MKIVVLAHTPPPFHGQSYMVQILLDCAQQDQAIPGTADLVRGAQPAAGVSRIEFVHVDFRLSDSIEDIGCRPWKKFARVLKYCAVAVWARFRKGASTLLYIPAPALRNAVYRDWLVMAGCRPFFRRRILWWQAAGLGHWVEREARAWERWMTRQLLGYPDLSIVLGAGTEYDARALASRRIEVVPNAVPDPCPQDAAEIVRARAARRLHQGETLRASGSGVGQVRFRILFLSLCYREKGLFDAVEAVACMNGRLAGRNAPVRIELEVAGRFYLAEEQREFEERIQRPDLLLMPDPASSPPPVTSTGQPAVRYHGFLSGDAKARLFRACDLLVFPTYYEAESYPLVLIEAMAHGLDILTTNWRNIPELLPSGYPGLVSPRNPAGIADALEHFLTHYEGGALRRRYEEFHSAAYFWRRMQSALRSGERMTDSDG